jgi:flavodoxin I
MVPIGLFYASSTGNCEIAAREIAESFKPYQVDVHDLSYYLGKKIPRYKNLIFGIPTWDSDVLYSEWEEFLVRIERSTLKGRNIALFGLGDQRLFPDDFVNSMGLLYDRLKNKKARILGFSPTSSYSFRKSAAVRNGRFVGLPLDDDNQAHMTKTRIQSWVDELKKDFAL